MEQGMLHAATTAFGMMFDPWTMTLLFVGCIMGLVLGILPGIGGLAGTALLLPFTFGMEPIAAMALLLGLGATTATGDPIPAILFGVPGGAGSAATVLDGLPMAKRGEASRALSAAYMSSLLGGVFGAILMGLHDSDPAADDALHRLAGTAGVLDPRHLVRRHAVGQRPAARPHGRCAGRHDRDGRFRSADRNAALHVRHALPVGRRAAHIHRAGLLRSSRTRRSRHCAHLHLRQPRQDGQVGHDPGREGLLRTLVADPALFMARSLPWRRSRHRRRDRGLDRLRTRGAHGKGRFANVRTWRRSRRHRLRKRQQREGGRRSRSDRRVRRARLRRHGDPARRVHDPRPCAGTGHARQEPPHHLFDGVVGCSRQHRRRGHVLPVLGTVRQARDPALHADHAVAFSASSTSAPSRARATGATSGPCSSSAFSAGP